MSLKSKLIVVGIILVVVGAVFLFSHYLLTPFTKDKTLSLTITEIRPKPVWGQYAVLSPDKKEVAFYRYEQYDTKIPGAYLYPRQDGSHSNTSLYVFNIENQTVRKLADVARPIMDPIDDPIAWVGDTIVYASDNYSGRLAEEPVGGVYVINADGSNKKQIDSRGWIKDVDLSPDGKRIVYIHRRELPDKTIKSELWISSIDRPEEKKKILEWDRITHAKWDAKSEKLTLCRGLSPKSEDGSQGIYRWDFEQGTFERIRLSQISSLPDTFNGVWRFFIGYNAIPIRNGTLIFDIFKGEDVPLPKKGWQTPWEKLRWPTTPGLSINVMKEETIPARSN